MKYAALCLLVLTALVVGGCATTSAPMSGQIVAAGPVSGPCPQCGQGVTVPASGAVLCPHCGTTVRLAQPAPMAAQARTMPSVVLPQVVTVCNRRSGGHTPWRITALRWRPPASRGTGTNLPVRGYYGGIMPLRPGVHLAGLAWRVDLPVAQQSGREGEALALFSFSVFLGVLFFAFTLASYKMTLMKKMVKFD